MIGFITWTASPNLLSSPITVRWYGLMFAIGFLVGYKIIERMFRHEGAPERWIAPLFFYVVIATIVGARLGHVFFYDWSYYSTHPGDIIKVWEGGLASHGGTLGIIIAILLYSRYVTHKPLLWTLDRLSVPTGFVAALIRIGNLMNHEIYGGATSLPWGTRFISNIGSWMRGAEPVFTAPSHPTQAYEAACYLVVFALCMWLYWKRNAEERRGLLFGVLMLGIFGTRFVIEFVKNVQESWELSLRESIGLDQGQLLSIPFIIAGVWFIARAMTKPRQTMQYPDEFPKEKKR